MLEKLKDLCAGALRHDSETPRVAEYARACVAGNPAPTVVDVGCGYGRTLRALRARGIDPLGVEVNVSIVEANKRDALRCVTPDEFMSGRIQADVIIMSHVVEHFAPDRLIEFVDGYLDRLAPGGHLIIATPLLHPRFFDDFDHVKPYHPMGFAMVFGGGSAQVQYYGRNRLQLVDLWFRRSPLAATFVRGIQIKCATTRLWQVVNLLGALAFRATGGWIGRATGWVGVFRKAGPVQSSSNCPL